MPSLKEIKGRITSVKSTLKITSAMKMVASAKYHKAQKAIGNMALYEEKLHSILSNLMSDISNEIEDDAIYGDDDSVIENKEWFEDDSDKEWPAFGEWEDRSGEDEWSEFGEWQDRCAEDEWPNSNEWEDTSAEDDWYLGEEWDNAEMLAEDKKRRRASKRNTKFLRDSWKKTRNSLLGANKGSSNTSESVYFETRNVRKVAILAFSSNASLCGAYNSNAVKNAEKLIDSYIARGIKKENITVYPIGKKMVKAMKKLGYTCDEDLSYLADFCSYSQAAEFAESLMRAYEYGKFDEIAFAYSHFVSMSSQTEIIDTYLPISLEKLQLKFASNTKSDSSEHSDNLEHSEKSENSDKVEQCEKSEKTEKAEKIKYIIEPNPERLLKVLLPKVLKLKLYTVCLDTQTAEQAARTVAMQTATDNGEEILEDLTLEYNKGRQQKITNELLDIIGGSLS